MSDDKWVVKTSGLGNSVYVMTRDGRYVANVAYGDAESLAKTHQEAHEIATVLAASQEALDIIDHLHYAHESFTVVHGDEWEDIGAFLRRNGRQRCS